MDESSLFWKRRLKGLSSIRRPSRCQVSRFVLVHSMTFTQRRNRRTMHLSKRIPVVKWRMATFAKKLSQCVYHIRHQIFPEVCLKNCVLLPYDAMSLDLSNSLTSKLVRSRLVSLVPLSKYKTCTNTTVAIQLVQAPLSQYRNVQVPLWQYKTCTTTTVTIQNM